MPNQFSKYAAFASVFIIAFSISTNGNLSPYLYFPMTIVNVLFFYNLYLFFRHIYKNKVWLVPKSLTRALAALSGLYVSATALAFIAFINAYPEFSELEGLEHVTRAQMIMGGMFFFIGGIFQFYFIAFLSKFGLRYIVWPRIFDF